MARIKVEDTWSGLCSVNPGTSVRGTALVSGYFLPLGAPLAQGSEAPHPSPDPILPAAAHDLGDIICRWKKKHNLEVEVDNYGFFWWTF